VGGSISLLHLKREAVSASETWILTWVDRRCPNYQLRLWPYENLWVFTFRGNAGTGTKLNCYKCLNYHKESSCKGTI
jgi:hypothetical protein